MPDCRFNVVLVEPEIPPNTGNIARLCSSTHTHLHLVEPFGFTLEDRDLRRAGMDYWQHVEWTRWSNWFEFTANVPDASQLWMIESGGPTRYANADFHRGDYLVFGRETLGLPESLCREAGERWLRIPMFNEEARSLNLSNCVALVLYEALRQLNFEGEL